MKLEIGTEIYYTGDYANPDGRGTVTAYKPPDRFSAAYEVTLEDGRIFKGLYPCTFDPGPGRRFIPRDEYETDRTTKLEAFMRLYTKGVSHD